MTVFNHSLDGDYARNDLPVAEWPGIAASMPGVGCCDEHPQQDYEICGDGSEDGKYSDETLHIHHYVSLLFRCTELHTNRSVDINSGHIITEDR